MKLVRLCLFGLLFTACADRAQPLVHGPADEMPQVFRSDQFSDLPQPPGYTFLPGADHVALAMGNGQARRLSCVLRSSGLQAPFGKALQEWYGDRLPTFGWSFLRLFSTQRPFAEASLWFNDSGERLLIETGRLENGHILRLRLIGDG